MNLFSPRIFTMANLQITFDEMLMEFEMFWDSEVPRFGEQVSYHISYHNRMGCQCTALISFSYRVPLGGKNFIEPRAVSDLPHSCKL
jgi:hypothetical protein